MNSVAINNRPRRFITTATLVADAITFGQRLPQNLDGIVAVARSGILPATIIATHKHLPLYTVGEDQGPTPTGHGARMWHHQWGPSYVALLDDTCGTGGSMIRMTKKMRDHWPRTELHRCAIYCYPDSTHHLDQWHTREPGTHLLEWHFANAMHTADYFWDLDGVICADFHGRDDDGPEYLAWLDTAPPLHVPRRHFIAAIVTARCERYRPQTMRWLKRHGVKCNHIWMGPWQSAEQRRKENNVASWKANIFGPSDAPIFVESDPGLAAAIATITGKPTLCPPAARLFP